MEATYKGPAKKNSDVSAVAESWACPGFVTRQMQDQLEMVVTKQLKEEDRQLQSIREVQFLLSRHDGL